MDRSNICYEEVRSCPRDSRDSALQRETTIVRMGVLQQVSSRSIAVWASAFWLIGTFFVYSLLSARPQKQICPPPRDQLSYSPAQDFIRYREVVFTNGFTEISKYQGRPSKQLDSEWFSLYTHMTRVPAAQAHLLANQAIEIPGDPGHHAVIFDVFHSLHCLDELRKQIWPGYYPSFAERYRVAPEVADIHLDHCIDGLRQALVCGADVSTIPFRLGEDEEDIRTVAGHVHTCRDWEAFEQYVVANGIRVPFHAKTKLEDSIS